MHHEVTADDLMAQELDKMHQVNGAAAPVAATTQVASAPPHKSLTADDLMAQELDQIHRAGSASTPVSAQAGTAPARTLADLKARTGVPSAENSSIIGEFNYSFTTPWPNQHHYLYRGQMQTDGKIEGQFLTVQDNKWVPATVEANQTAALNGFVRQEILQQRQQNPNAIVNINSEIPAWRISHASGEYGTAIAKMEKLEAGKKGADQLNKFLVEQPELALSVLQDHPGMVHDILARNKDNPYLPGVINDNRQRYKGTPLGDALAKINVPAAAPVV